jgi:hypothetical protein
MAEAALLAPLEASRVVMDLQPGERVAFAGTGIEIEVLAKSGKHSRLRVTAPRRVKIERAVEGEVLVPAAYARHG